MSEFPLTVTSVFWDGTRRVLTVVGEDGVEFEHSLRRTDDLIRDLTDASSAHSFDGCTHEHTEIRTKIASNGMAMAAAQCLRCGEMCGQFIKKSNCPENRPPWDHDLAHSLDELRRLAEIAVYQKHLAIQYDESRQYELYLQSPEWRQKRSWFWNGTAINARDAASSGLPRFITAPTRTYTRNFCSN